MKKHYTAILIAIAIVGMVSGCVSLNQSPVAAFTASAFRPAASTEVSFDASASADPDGTIVQYAWDFGDGFTGSGVNTTHVYANDTGGIVIYTVLLTVTDDDGATGTASVEIRVTPPLPDEPA